MAQLPSPGRIVNYINYSGINKPAIITALVSEPSEGGENRVNLRVFADEPGELPHLVSIRQRANDDETDVWDWPVKV